MERPITSYYKAPIFSAKVKAARARQQRRERNNVLDVSRLCPHGYRKYSFCLDCTPSSACPCGSKKHRKYCCENEQWNKFGRKQADEQPAAASEPAPAPAPAPEPAKKMHKVMVGAVEMMVEHGATMTIAGVPITFH